MSLVPIALIALLSAWMYSDAKRKMYPHGGKFVLGSLLAIIPIVAMMFLDIFLALAAFFIGIALPFVIGAIYQKNSDDHVKAIWREKFASGKFDDDAPTPTDASKFTRSNDTPPGDMPLFSVPPRLMVRQIFFALSATYSISDELGGEYARIQRKIIAIAPQFVVYDRLGHEIGLMVGRLFSIRPTYDLYYSGIGYIATIKGKLLKFIGSEYWIENPAGDELFRCFGDFFSWEFQVVDRNHVPMATVSKKIFAFTDTYQIMLLPGSDPSMIIPLIIVLDYQKHHGSSGYIRHAPI